MPHYWLKNLSFLCLLGFSGIQAQRTPEDYFGQNYAEAMVMSKILDPQFLQAGRTYNLPSDLLASVVFPELIRYSRFRDLMETAALEQIYVRFGKERADFSIGPFQMKPSFVETIEQRIKSDPTLAKTFGHLTAYPNQNPESIRRLRVERLSDPTWQTAYLAAFVTIAQHDYHIGSDTDEHQRILLVATAYNRGIGTPREELEKLAQKKNFPYGRNMITGFSYYDVARHFHDNHSLK